MAERFRGRGDKRRRYGGERVLRCVLIHMLKNGVSSWGIEIDRCRDPLPLVPLVGGWCGGYHPRTIGEKPLCFNNLTLRGINYDNQTNQTNHRENQRFEL